LVSLKMRRPNLEVVTMIVALHFWGSAKKGRISGTSSHGDGGRERKGGSSHGPGKLPHMERGRHQTVLVKKQKNKRRGEERSRGDDGKRKLVKRPMRKSSPPWMQHQRRQTNR